jgi:MFS family permease
VFGIALGLGALAPGYVLFAVALVVVGIATQTFTTTTQSLVQLSTEPAMRGRVVAIMLAVGLGGTPIGAPIIGLVVDAFGPRWGVAVGAASGFAALGVGVFYVIRYQHLRLRLDGRRVRVSMDAAGGQSRPASVPVLPAEVDPV